MSKPILVYGAYGYTGALIARLARSKGVPLVLAGRDEARLAALAAETGHAHRALSLDDESALVAAFREHACVLHCAGPFEHTYRAVANACIASGAHYLDITGEIAVFEGLAELDAKAKAKGVMLLPGTGFDVVPSDCLAAHLARRLPGAKSLTLAFRSVGGDISHGTATTMVEILPRGCFVRRDGKLVQVPTAFLARSVPFPGGEASCMSIPWGDVSTAYHSTGIPDIEVLTAAPKSLVMLARASRPFTSMLGTNWMQSFLKARVDARGAGPDAAHRERARGELWGEAVDASGKRVSSTLVTMEGYTLTSITALDIAQRVARGEVKPGFMTPSKAFGPDYILGFEGSVRADVV